MFDRYREHAVLPVLSRLVLSALLIIGLSTTVWALGPVAQDEQTEDTGHAVESAPESEEAVPQADPEEGGSR